MEEEKIYSVTEPVGSEQDAPVSNMEMLSDVFFKEEARRLKEAFCFERDADDSRLFHLSFELGVPFPYPCQCGMGGNTIIGNQCVTNISNLNFSHF